jgi:hypothetical protein
VFSLSYVLERLLHEDLGYWENLVMDYENQTKALKVPHENSIESLHDFNIRVNDLYTRAAFDFARARRNKDAIERFVENVLKDYYNGPNELARRAGGIQYARAYPAPDNWREPTVNLFDLEDRFRYFYYMMDSVIKSLEAKAESRITNNSLLKLESALS